jgi:phosphoribosyl-AMP cyclohydrolase
MRFADAYSGGLTLQFDIDQLKWGANGLIPAIVQDTATGQVLMLAYMNKESLAMTITTGQTWFYSRSRQRLWHKGEQSGNVQIVETILTDCDQDTILIRARQTGVGACHEGDYTCFHYPVVARDSVAAVSNPVDTPAKRRGED